MRHALILLSGVWLVCAGCAAKKTMHAYEGPERPRQEIAILKGSAHRLFLLFFYIRSNFILPAGVDGHRAARDTGDWAVLPGPHTVNTLYSRKKSYNFYPLQVFSESGPVYQPVTFTAEANHQYRVDGDLVEPEKAHPGEFCAWVVDDESGQLVVPKQCISVAWAPKRPETDTERDERQQRDIE